jgi:hypothetical protein
MKGEFFIAFAVCFGLLTIGLTITPSTSYACKCVGPQSVEREMDRSQAVFSGQVIELLNQKSQQKILFEVNESWKGVSESQVILVSVLSDCSVNFYQGGEYLIYAREYEGELTTNICSRTIELSKAEEDLALLGKGNVPTKKVELESELNHPALFKKMWMPVFGLIVAGFLLVWWNIRKNIDKH